MIGGRLIIPENGHFLKDMKEHYLKAYEEYEEDFIGDYYNLHNKEPSEEEIEEHMKSFDFGDYLGSLADTLEYYYEER